MTRVVQIEFHQRPARALSAPGYLVLGLVLLGLLAPATMAGETGGGTPQPQEGGQEVTASSGAVEETGAEAGESGSAESEGPETSDAEKTKQAGNETEGFRKKWRQFLAGARGLTTWNLFNDRLTLRAGFRIQIDGTAVGENDLFQESYGEIDSSLDFRRIRLFAKGTIDKHLRYELSYDFGADFGIKDAYVEGIHDGLKVFGYDIGQFRAGKFREPFSLQRQMSSNDLAFLELGLPVGAMAPGRNLGFMLHDNAALGRVSWAVGFFSFGSKEEDNQSNSTLSLTARVTGLPVYRNHGKTLLHLGASFSSREPSSSEVQYAARPEARFVRTLVDTGPIPSEKLNLLGVEAAAVRGPLSLQAEAIVSAVSSSELDDPRFWGAYVEAGWFLTGEVRPYRQSDGVFGRVQPGVKYEKGLPFRKKSGGALEVALRLSNLDLDDGLVRGGKMLDLGVGFNWYVNPTSRVMFDFINAKVKDSGTSRILLVRYQYNPRW